MHNYSLSTAAKLLGTGRTRLKAQLTGRGILDARGFPAPQHIAAGRLVTELREHTRRIDWNNGGAYQYHVTLVTPEGLRWLAELLGVTIKNMDAPAQPQPASADATALEHARSAIRLLRMHINCPTAVDSATALAVADEALQLLEKRSAA